MPARFRNLAPLSDAAWEAIDTEAARTIRQALTARAIVDFNGPHGPTMSCVSTGRSEAISTIAGVSNDVQCTLRTSIPLIELRADFSLRREELEAIDNGARDPDLAPLVSAARSIARAEDLIVFHGSGQPHTLGIAGGSSHPVLSIPTSPEEYPLRVAEAIALLETAAVGGPYALLLGPTCYTAVTESLEHGGYPVLKHVTALVRDGVVLRADALEGALVMSMRGEDFELVVGNDFSVSYVVHDEDSVTFRIDETIAFINLNPDAAVAILSPLQ